jgi:hypothetical protein
MTQRIQNGSKEQLSIDADFKHMEALYVQGHYEESLAICLQLMHTHQEMVNVWSSAAANCIMLARWQEAVDYAQIALARGRKTLPVYDALASAHGAIGQWNEARYYGLQALTIRDRRFGGEPIIPPPEPGPLPPLPSAQTRECNIIAFSLFGGDCKYCETAILNAYEQPDVYPYWICRFYVDDSVPESVINRLRAGGGQIVRVKGPALQWPGQLWRFLTLDDPQAHRILFRDADSVISRREAAAVEQWLTSGKRFHMMRDDCSHTELIMAGLWGVVAGSLPPLEQLMQRFMSAPLQSRHFADQYFRRQYVWPYARASLMQHDSVFGFMDAVPFPDEKMPDQSSVGNSEGLASFIAKGDLPNGSEVVWELHRIEKSAEEQSREVLVCSYPATVKDGTVQAHIPMRYARSIRQGTARVAVRACSAA